MSRQYRRSHLPTRLCTCNFRSVPTWFGIFIAASVAIGTICSAIYGFRNMKESTCYPKINYALADGYPGGQSFFNSFDFFTDADPTHGFVRYENRTIAEELQLTTSRFSQVETPFKLPSRSDRTAIVRVDSANKNATDGRSSVRIESKQSYDNGLFLFDVVHSPWGCGTWPALWLLGPDWPYGGEIDVMESSNTDNKGNTVSLHTSNHCYVDRRLKRMQSGKALTTNCWVGARDNSGCAVSGPIHSYGPSFNARKGGVYAVEVRDEGIRVWFFTRLKIPVDVALKDQPDPSSWSMPLAEFPASNCDIQSHFTQLKIIINISLCGDLAGRPDEFNRDPRCTGTCTDWVTTQKDEFEMAYWEFNSIKVYIPR